MIAVDVVLGLLLVGLEVVAVRRYMSRRAAAAAEAGVRTQA